ncbi:unnamed protein product [Durusdinium trenchii]|uniref:Uncharacterized protein n=1 Tax=Durusdinium trenchii TaxID=1381693 RepID=A0ABP0SSL1_9DINO
MSMAKRQSEEGQIAGSKVYRRSMSMLVGRLENKFHKPRSLPLCHVQEGQDVARQHLHSMDKSSGPATLTRKPCWLASLVDATMQTAAPCMRVFSSLRLKRTLMLVIIDLQDEAVLPQSGRSRPLPRTTAIVALAEDAGARFNLAKQ